MAKVMGSTGSDHTIDKLMEKITALETKVNNLPATFRDTYFKVGSIIITDNGTNPSTYIGGTWQQITGDNYLMAGNGFNTGGSNTFSHTHTQNAHSHTVNSHSHAAGGLYGCYEQSNPESGGVNTYRYKSSAQWNANYILRNAGNGMSDNWKRTTGMEIGGSTANTAPGTNSQTPAINSTSVTITPKFQRVYVWRRTA